MNPSPTAVISARERTSRPPCGGSRRLGFDFGLARVRVHQPHGVKRALRVRVPAVSPSFSRLNDDD